MDMEHADVKHTINWGDRVEHNKRDTGTGKGNKTQTPLRGHRRARGEHKDEGKRKKLPQPPQARVYHIDAFIWFFCLVFYITPAFILLLENSTGSRASLHSIIEARNSSWNSPSAPLLNTDMLIRRKQMEIKCNTITL